MGFFGAESPSRRFVAKRGSASRREFGMRGFQPIIARRQAEVARSLNPLTGSLLACPREACSL